jgi:hypothetical protein
MKISEISSDQDNIQVLINRIGQLIDNENMVECFCAVDFWRGRLGEILAQNNMEVRRIDEHGNELQQ